ncbi:MAG: antibiotic biosynthesis monooxygenase [Planctomycetes bacterium]|nr:antibiotic biosynthesis monooxygenase [Planctomycetota bacterium]
MYIAMNRFRVARGREEDFASLWRLRERYLSGVAGFRTFLLLRGEPQADHTLFVSHSEWDSASAFRAWTDSDAFRRAHADARTPPGTLLGHPQFEGYEVLLRK